MLKFSHGKMEGRNPRDQHTTKEIEELRNNSCFQSLSMNMQSLSINMEVDKSAPKEDTRTMFRVTLIPVKYFLPICEFHLKNDDAVDHAYKHIQERFNDEKFYYDQQDGHGGIIIVRARSKQDGTVCGVAMVEKVKLLQVFLQGMREQL